MSLLIQKSNERVNNIARSVFEKHFQRDPKLNNEYDDRRKMLMYEDILYNMGYLDTAIEFDDDKIFPDYAIWIYHLLCHLMKNVDRVRIKDQMVLHYEILLEVLSENLSKDEAEKASYHINNAIRATENEAVDFVISDGFELGNYGDIKKEYLRLLMNNDTRGAIGLINRVSASGIKLNEIYVEIMQEVMYEVGNLWHQKVITVDKEHYCTATTQVVLSQFYPIIFSTPKNGCKILTCSIGSELHEMGIRMVSDLFEYHGWESIYLGSAVPKEAILHAIEENNPNLIGLSVTMPQHLSLCFEVVNAIRKQYKDIRIAVGGRAFLVSDHLWKKWDVDISTENAVQLVEWANMNIVSKMRINL